MSGVLVLDNYDSFTFNLVQLVASRGETVEVVRNDAESVDQLLARRPSAIVISPGPGRPEDAGVSVELVRRRAPIPLLGVCLGHQAIGYAFGATIRAAGRLMHGKVSAVRHDDRGIFVGVANPFDATRYHSLAVDASTLPEELVPVAWGDDDSLQAMRHRELPYWGVQFHPESILTAAGPTLVDRFLALRSPGGDGGL